MRSVRLAVPEPPPGLEVDRIFRSSEAAILTGCTLRQLQWWDEQGALKPAVHRGHLRQYSTPDVLALSVISELRRKGLSLQKIRRVLRPLLVDIRRRIEDAAKKDYCVVTDGQRVAFGDPAFVVAEMVKARNGMHLVSLSDTVARIIEYCRTHAEREEWRSKPKQWYPPPPTRR